MNGMKVRIGELKTHLSKYVQALREGGEPVEVCVRDEAVAYLTAAGSQEEPARVREQEELARRLEASGLRLQSGSVAKAKRLPPVGRAGDGRRVINSVGDMRSEKGW